MNPAIGSVAGTVELPLLNLRWRGFEPQAGGAVIESPEIDSMDAIGCCIGDAGGEQEQGDLEEFHGWNCCSAVKNCRAACWGRVNVLKQDVFPSRWGGLMPTNALK